MIKKLTTGKWFIGWIAFVFVMLSATNFVFGQCGNYFKINYHAVDKTRVINGREFDLADWTGDGKSDFWNFQPNPNGLTNDVLVYPLKPTGYWDWDNPIVLTTSLTNSQPASGPPVIKDFNSDGKIDVFFNGRINQNVNNQTLIPLAPVTFSSAGFFAAAVDVNGDGLLDWINNTASGSSQTNLGYHPGTADGAFGARVSIFANSDSANSIVTGDFNGDGKIDIAYANTGAFHAFFNNGNGTFSGRNTTSDSHWHTFAEVRDFNRDGKADILTKDSSLTRMFILYGQADGTFNEQEIPVNSTLNNNYKAAELNGDNNIDIIVFNKNDYSIYTNNGSGGFTRTNYQRSLLGDAIFDLLVEDFSGDNKADVYDHTVGLGGAKPFNTFGEEVIVVRENGCQPFGETKRANFDGNYEGDLVLWNPSNGGWTSTSLSFFSNAGHTNFTFGSAGEIPAHGDYDGDGKTDYAVFHTGTGDWRIRRSSDSLQVTVHFGLANDVAVPNDYDGDGKTDLAVWRPSDGNWYWFNSASNSYSIVHFGLNGDKPIPADYDGDGKIDIAVYRPSQGYWYCYKSSNQSVLILHWGIDTDIPLPADYDGDGKADFAVYRGGDWYILRSGSYSYNFIHWGLGTDIPMPMKRDGNSDSAELIVYRPSNGHWYDYRISGFPWNFNNQGSVPVRFGLPNN